jgi:pilus assembly protein CpaE
MYPISVGLVVETKDLWEEVMSAVQTLAIRVVFELPEIPSDWSEFEDRIERVRPDVILLEVPRLSGRLEEVVKRIRSTAGEPAVFALHPSAQSDSILAALRAGASEYLFPPVAEPLKAALDRLAESREKSREKLLRGGKTIGFLSSKGGCGATTVACHVAADLARQDAGKILLADLDLQTGLIGFLLKTKSAYTIADAVNNLQRLDHSYWQGLVSNGIPNLEIITAPSTPTAKKVSAAHLKQVLAFARTHYDWCVVDLGRNLTPDTMGMMDLIDETYLVTTQEVPALHHTKQIIHLLLETGYARAQLRLVLNRTSKRSDVTVEELESMLGVSVYVTLVNDFEGLHEAFSEGRLLDSSTSLGQDFARLAGRIAGVPEPKKKKFSLFG